MPESSERPKYADYQAAYFQRKNADPKWRAARLEKHRAYKVSKKAKSDKEMR